MSSDVTLHDTDGMGCENPGLSHSVALRWHEPDDTGDPLGARHAIVLDLEAAEYLQTQLASAIRSARHRQVSDARRGPCDTCSGTRMVMVHNGHIERREHCTDCLPGDLFVGPLPPELRSPDE